MAAPSDQQIKERIQEIVHPATLAQVSYCERTDTSHSKRGGFMEILPVMRQRRVERERPLSPEIIWARAPVSSKDRKMALSRRPVTSSDLQVLIRAKISSIGIGSMGSWPTFGALTFLMGFFHSGSNTSSLSSQRKKTRRVLNEA